MPLSDQLRLIVITDHALLRGRALLEVCRAAVAGGTTMVQVRMKDATPRDTLHVTRELVQALPVPVIVNDRVDVALLAGAAGCHLGQDDLPLAVARAITPPGFLLGASVGSPAEAAAAGSLPDYWSVGPCYETGTKPDAGRALGPEGFARLARLAPPGMPVIAIGGITAENAAPLVQAGAVGVAVVAAVISAEHPTAAARALRAALAPS